MMYFLAYLAGGASMALALWMCHRMTERITQAEVDCVLDELEVVTWQGRADLVGACMEQRWEDQ